MATTMSIAKPATLRLGSRAASKRASRAMGASRRTVMSAADDKFANYTPKIGILFPGQGAQSVGMAKEVCEKSAAAKGLFEQASDILGYDLLKVCTDGPTEKLDSTAVSQPAIYVASFAALELLKEMEGDVQPDVAAGLSLGEYTALAYAGAMSFEDGLKLVQIRGESMQAAADLTPSGMCSIIGLDSDVVERICAKASEMVGQEGAIKLANYLCPGNYAVSGSIEACDAVDAIAKPEFKARMTVRLKVAGAFHTDFMAPAAEKLQEALANTAIVEPRIPVVSNVDATPHSEPEVIKAILVKQLTSPVLWEKTLVTLQEKGMEKAYEVGPNKVISGIFKRIDKKFPITNITV
eukprot:jgi/Tetstr1/450172/TSEL_037213.t1